MGFVGGWPRGVALVPIRKVNVRNMRATATACTCSSTCC